MKKTSIICLLIMICSVNCSFSQNKECPPIQKFLEKIKLDEHTWTGNEAEVSQKLSKNTFIYTEKDKTDGFKTFQKYENIDWSSYKGHLISGKIEYKNNKYLGCIFFFSTEFTEIYYNDEEIDEPKQTNKFSFYVLAEDEKEFLKVLKDWEGEL